MNEQRTIVDDLLDGTELGRRERMRAELRVAVTEELLLSMQRRGISRAEMARRLGVSRPAVTNALTGNRNMTLNMLADIAQALGLEAKLRLEQRPHPLRLAATSASAGPARRTVTAPAAGRTDRPAALRGMSTSVPPRVVAAVLEG